MTLSRVLPSTLLGIVGGAVKNAEGTVLGEGTGLRVKSVRNC